MSLKASLSINGEQMKYRKADGQRNIVGEPRVRERESAREKKSVVQERVLGVQNEMKMRMDNRWRGE